MNDWKSLSDFRELWFPCPRIRLPELGPVGPVFLVGDVRDLTKCVKREEQQPGDPLGWKLSMTHVIGQGSFHGLIRLEDGRLHPISREGGEDVFKSSWVTFTR